MVIFLHFFHVWYFRLGFISHVESKKKLFWRRFGVILLGFSVIQAICPFHSRAAPVW
jgi:hypothetical protein